MEKVYYLWQCKLKLRIMKHFIQVRENDDWSVFGFVKEDKTVKKILETGVHASGMEIYKVNDGSQDVFLLSEALAKKVVYNHIKDAAEYCSVPKDVMELYWKFIQSSIYWEAIRGEDWELLRGNRFPGDIKPSVMDMMGRMANHNFKVEVSRLTGTEAFMFEEYAYSRVGCFRWFKDLKDLSCKPADEIVRHIDEKKRHFVYEEDHAGNTHVTIEYNYERSLMELLVIRPFDVKFTKDRKHLVIDETYMNHGWEKHEDDIRYVNKHEDDDDFCPEDYYEVPEIQIYELNEEKDQEN